MHFCTNSTCLNFMTYILKLQQIYIRTKVGPWLFYSTPPHTHTHTHTPVSVVNRGLWFFYYLNVMRRFAFFIFLSKLWNIYVSNCVWLFTCNQENILCTLSIDQVSSYPYMQDHNLQSFAHIPQAWTVHILKCVHCLKIECRKILMLKVRSSFFFFFFFFGGGAICTSSCSPVCWGL